jgi:TetR/AcrR family transcriptional regulator, regulator of cefoperazone and chloramphenicol sensitivity
MKSSLEKAKKDPESTKARILSAARNVYGEYGYHGTTMRMIAKEVGIDISTLHYHWGEKKELYEAVIIDINNDLGKKLQEVEKLIHGHPLAERIDIAIDIMVDYLFLHPEISDMVLSRYFGTIRNEEIMDIRVPEFAIDIVRSMGLKKDRENIGQSMASVLTIMNSIHGFISGQKFFSEMVKKEKDEYIVLVKKTLKIIFISAFTRNPEMFEEVTPGAPPDL